jgi:hypothetical protein
MWRREVGVDWTAERARRIPPALPIRFYRVGKKLPVRLAGW